MNPALKWKLIAGFVLVFVAGGLTGAFLSVIWARQFLLGPSHHDIVAQHMRERLQRELELTPQQLTKISPIIDRSAARLEGIRIATAQEVRQTFTDVHREIARNLTEEQRTRYEQMNQRREKWLRTHRSGSRSSPAALSNSERE